MLFIRSIVGSERGHIALFILLTENIKIYIYNYNFTFFSMQ